MTDANIRETAENVRTTLLGLLQTYASPDEQREHQKEVPISVSTELVCGWADDLYHPDTEVHTLAFSPAERAALADFDSQIRHWSDKVTSGDVEVVIASAAGLALARAANLALAAFATAPDTRPDAAVTQGESLIEQQNRVCQKYGAAPLSPVPGSKLGIALQTLGRLPIHGVRLPPTETTCGWYIHAGDEWFDAGDFYQPLCIEHLAEYCAIALPFLALPPGYHFMADGQGFVDVWQDE